MNKPKEFDSVVAACPQCGHIWGVHIGFVACPLCVLTGRLDELEDRLASTRPQTATQPPSSWPMLAGWTVERFGPGNLALEHACGWTIVADSPMSLNSALVNRVNPHNRQCSWHSSTWAR